MWLANPLGSKEVRYSSGFCLAGDILLDHVLKTGDEISVLVYPIILSYCHGIELHLKNILRDGQELLIEKPNIPGIHDLRKLWIMCKPIIIKVWPKGDNDPLRAMDRLINELSEIDPDGMGFRYAKDLKGKATLQNLEAADLESFGEVIRKMTHFLDCVSFGISHNLSVVQKMAAENADW